VTRSASSSSRVKLKKSWLRLHSLPQALLQQCCWASIIKRSNPQRTLQGISGILHESPSMTSSVPSPTAAPRRRFATTRWSLIRQASQGHDTPARAALEELCQAYWLPVYGFMRRQTNDVHEAQDWTQGFFASLLSRDAFADLNPEFGRFCSRRLGILRATNVTTRPHFREAQRSRSVLWTLNMAKSSWPRSWLAARHPNSSLSDDGRWLCWTESSAVCVWKIRTLVETSYLRCCRLIWPDNRPKSLWPK